MVVILSKQLSVRIRCENIAMTIYAFGKQVHDVLSLPSPISLYYIDKLK